MASETVFEGNLLLVRRDAVRLPDGHPATREYIVHPGAVLVVPVLPDGRLVIERQFRYPLGRVFVEFPAGKLEPGESALATARRELIEEAGYAALEWAQLGVIHPVLSYSTEAIEIYIATGLSHVGAKLDDEALVGQHGDDQHGARMDDVLASGERAVGQPHRVAAHVQELAVEHGLRRHRRLDEMGVVRISRAAQASPSRRESRP